jgi:hypothetical protein
MSKVICQGVMKNIDTSMGTELPIDYPWATMDSTLHHVKVLVKLSHFLKVSIKRALYVTQFKAFR